VGLGEPTIYTVALDALSIPYETLSPELRDALDARVFAYYEGVETHESHKAALNAVEYLRARGCDGIVLGCTEIPLLLWDRADAPDLVNPTELLAESAVRLAME
jgi:aspartate racemase